MPDPGGGSGGGIRPDFLFAANDGLGVQNGSVRRNQRIDFHRVSNGFCQGVRVAKMPVGKVMQRPLRNLLGSVRNVVGAGDANPDGNAPKSGIDAYSGGHFLKIQILGTDAQNSS